MSDGSATENPERTGSELIVRRMPYLAGLDGLRAVAVLAVVLYHTDVGWMPGGFMGVEVFFVLSGYLITALLVEELATTRTIRLGAFWRRRARRLLPTLAVAVAASALWAVFIAGEVFERLRDEILAAASYVSNWFLIVNNESYFDSFGRPSPFRHLWSLAIEEQFYVIWPMILLAGITVLGRRRALFGTLVLAGLSAALMISLFEPGTDPSRVYYGTDTRIAGLLLGAAVGMVWRPWSRDHRMPPSRVRRLTGPGLLGAAGLLFAFLTLGEVESATYRYGFLLVDVSTVLMIVALAAPGAPLGRSLGVRPLRWIGLRSYAIYLWHWPVIVFTEPGEDVPLDGFSLFVFRVVVTLVLADVTRRLVEEPFRRSPFLRARSPAFYRPRLGARLLPAVVVVVALLAGTAAMFAAFASSDSGAEAAAAVPALDLDELATHTRPPSTTAAAPEVSASTTASTTTVPALGEAPSEVTSFRPDFVRTDPPRVTPAAPPAGPVLVIGDSVALGARDALMSELGDDTLVDAVVARQFRDAAGIVEAYRSQGLLGQRVVVHLGTNGPPTTEAFDALMTSLADVDTVVIVSVHVPRPWEDQTNDVLRQGTADWPNLRLADWGAASAGNPQWFGHDGVHLTPDGAAAYAQLVATTLDP